MLSDECSFLTSPLTNPLCVSPNYLTLFICLCCMWNIIEPRCTLLPLLARQRARFITLRIGQKTIYHCWFSIKMANLRDIYSYQAEEDSLRLLRLLRTPGQPYWLCCITRILCMLENSRRKSKSHGLFHLQILRLISWPIICPCAVK